jgi:hypothetical protein
MTYILHAKHASLYLELFNGTDAFTMPTPAPAFVILYLIFFLCYVFIVSHILIAFIVYFGMFLCLVELLKNKWVAMLSELMFSILPFYVVYGFSVIGQLILLRSIIPISQNPKNKNV